MWHASWDHCLAFSSLPQQSLPLCPDIRGGTPLSGAAARNDYIARSAAQGLSGMRSVADTYLDHMYLKPSWIRNYN